MTDAIQQYGNIVLGGRGGTGHGVLKISGNGLFWRKAGGNKSLEVLKKDIDKLTWTKIPRGCQLGVKKKQGPIINFIGFRDKDFEALAEVSVEQLQLPLQEEPLSVTGRNWGDAVIEGASLTFRIHGKRAFQVALPDVTQVQNGKDEVMFEFPIADSAGDKEDALVEMGFYIPRTNEEYQGADEETAASKVFFDRVIDHTDVGAAAGDAAASFDNIAVLNPRGRFDVELYSSFLKLIGQAQDYRIQYDSIVRIFVLPKSATPHTLVVISLDPPIRKGQTYYHHILCQFPTDEEATVELDMSQEDIDRKNEKSGGKLQGSYSGAVYDVFSKVVRGLSGAKLTRPGAFRNVQDNGHALRCSYKADDGYLYPLEKAFFYVHKPPTLLVYDEIESIQFMRQGGGVLGASAKTFDIAVRMSKEAGDFVFRGIQKQEWQNLFNWIAAKQLPLENFNEAKQGPHGAQPTGGLDLGPDIDAGMRAMQAKGELDSDEEDEDFEAGSEDEEDADDSDGGSDVPEGREAKPKEAKEKKRPSSAAPKPEKVKKAKTVAAEGDAEGGKQKKKRKPKDKNAPKKNMSAFMFFSNENRERVKTENEGIAFGEIGKLLGEQWKSISPSDKSKYEAMAAKDKERYQRDMEKYRALLASQAAAGGGD